MFAKNPSLGPNQSLKILFSAYHLNKEFSLEELAVQAWKLYPSDFGMTTYSFPDVMRVYSKVHGERGLIKTGMLKCVDERPSGSLFQLSRKGFWRVCRSVLPAEVLDDNQRREREQKQRETEREERKAREREFERRKQQRERKEQAEAARSAKKLAEQSHSLGSVQQDNQIDASSTRGDAGRRMESPDSEKRQAAHGDRSAPELARNKASVLVQRVEAGRIVETVQREIGEQEGAEQKGGGEKITVASTTQDMGNRGSSGEDRESSERGSADVAQTPADAVAKSKSSLVPCFYCGAGTAPQFIDPQKNPMCGGCQRDKGFGVKTPKRWRSRVSGEMAAVKLPSVSKKIEAETKKAEAAKAKLEAAKSDALKAADAKVLDFTVRVPSRYVIRKFDKVRLGGHSRQCIEASGHGCIVMCPLRKAWEADGRPTQ